MNTVAVVSIAMGILIIAARGPLIFAPEGTLRVFLSVLETSARVRTMGCLLALLSFAALRGVAGADGTLPHVIAIIGWWLVGGSVFLLLLPGVYQRLARSILAAFDTTALRAIGVLGVGIGVLFVYFGVTAA